MSALLKCETITSAAHTSSRGDSNGEAERSLWSAVLLRAIDDARGDAGVALSGHAASAARDAENARRWLSQGGADFRRVCWWAGLEPDVVQESLRRDGIIPPLHEQPGAATATTTVQDDLVFAAIAAAAAEGRVCPTNTDLAKASGWVSRSGAGRAVQRLILDGRIAIDYGHRKRIVTVLSTGQRTARS